MCAYPLWLSAVGHGRLYTCTKCKAAFFFWEDRGRTKGVQKYKEQKGLEVSTARSDGPWSNLVTVEGVHVHGRGVQTR